MPENSLPWKKLLLLVEESSSRANVFKRLLVQETGYGILIALTGDQALKTLNVVIPDLVVCVQQLPDMQGIELYKQIRQREIFEQLPFLLLGGARTEREQHFFRLRTPLAFDELLQALQELLQA